MRRRQLITGTAAGAAALTIGARGRAADAAKPIRIGFTLSQTGPYAPGAGISQAPSYELWRDEVNAKGGLEVKGEGRRKVEFVSIDDRSETETARRYYEKLINDEKVDLLLPPWGTAMAFAVAPVINKAGYPVIFPTATSIKLKTLKLPYFYAVLQQPDAIMGAIVGLLADLKAKGKVSKVGLAYVKDLFGIELKNTALPLLKAAGLSPVEVKEYPLAVNDLSPVLKAFKTKGVDAFLGLTYPPDAMLATGQAKEVEFNPGVYITAVGTAFPPFRDRFGGAEGALGIAGWNPKVKHPGAKAFFDAHVAKHKKEPDRWASAFAYASLQILEQAVAQVGLDRKKIKQHLDATEFATVAGPIKFKDGFNVSTPGMVGQWQNKEFEIVWPQSHATATLVVPKPAWTAPTALGAAP